MKWLYAALCVVGTALPYYFLAQFLAANGPNLPLFVSLMFSNPIAAFFVADVVVSSLVLWAFIYHDTRARPLRLWWLPVVANLLVGVSLGLPLFLLLRELEGERRPAPIGR